MYRRIKFRGNQYLVRKVDNLDNSNWIKFASNVQQSQEGCGKFSDLFESVFKAGLPFLQTKPKLQMISIKSTII